MAAVSVDSEMAKLLCEIGFVAALRGRPRDAAMVFEGLSAARPDSEYPAIGAGLAQIAGDQLDDAIRTLRDVALVRNPKSAEARCILGLALKLAGRASESESVLRDAAAAGEPHAQELAEELLAP